MTTREADLPEGPVTIMFTDIVGSTALRTTLGDREADELFGQHDELLRREIEEHRGTDQKAALGDGFLAVFVSTRRALAAAVAIQRALDAFNHPRSGPPLKVRIGLNTGEVTWQDGHLSGEAVHAASRVCAAATGGQILASDVTRQLAGTVPDLSFVDAGEHDLKGFPHPWRLWEVAWVRATPQGREEVFVERAKELAVLRSHLTDALDGRGGLVLVGGEPGVGKTTLVRQLIRDAEARGALALFGRCYEFEGALPYSPFIEMLEHALSVMPPELVREDMGDDAAEVARMVPELRRRFPDIPAPLDLPPEQQRRYFFNAVEAFLRRAAERFPLMLVLDDVHWADVPTLLLIEHMARVMPQTRVLGVGTYRDVELDVSRPLVATLERLVRGRFVERISLSRLDLGGVARMIEALAGREPPQRVVSVVYDETEGNPFFVMEVFRHLAEEGRLFDAAGAFRDDLSVDELDVPESVRLVVGRRLERLGPEAQRALAAAAVVGRGFPFALLEEIADVPTPQLVDIVEEAEAARVVVPEERGGAIHYTFAHELIRQTLLTSLSLLRRQRLHLAVADATERLFPEAATTRPSELAHHLLQAGAAADPTRTLDYLERAAHRAMESAAFEDAMQVTTDALSIEPGQDTARRARLMELQGKAARALGHYDECLRIWDQVVTAYAELGERAAAADLCWHMGYLLAWLNRFADAFVVYERALEVLGDQRGPEMAGLMASRALLLGFSGAPGMYEVSHKALGEAEEVARGTGDVRQLALVNWGRCIVDWCWGRVPQACDAGMLSVQQLREAGDVWTLVDALGWASLPLGSATRYAEGRAFAEEAVELATRLGHVSGEIIGRRGVLINGVPVEADLDVLERSLLKDLELCTSISSPWVSQTHAWLTFVTTFRGRFDEGLAHAEQAAALEPDSAWTGMSWGCRLANRLHAGDEAEARRMLVESSESLAGISADDPCGSLLRLSIGAEAAAVLGMSDLCGTLYPVVADVAERVVLRPFDWALGQRVAGMAAACAGAWDEAEGHFRTAMTQAAELPNRLDEPQVHHRYAEALLRHGGARGDVERMLGRATDGYRRLGMPVLAEQAQALLAG